MEKGFSMHGLLGSGLSKVRGVLQVLLTEIPLNFSLC